MLQNPEFKGFPAIPIEFDNHGNKGYIEWPDEWEWVYREKDGFPPPESYHRDEGYELSAGAREWEAGYKQKVQLEGGTVYHLRITFTPALYRYDSNPIDPAFFQWRFEVRGDDLEIDSPWSSAPLEALQHEYEHAFEFKSRRATTADIAFVARGTAWDYIYKIHLYRVDMRSGSPSTARTDHDTTSQPLAFQLPADGWALAIAAPRSGVDVVTVHIAPSLQAEPPVARIATATAAEVALAARLADLDGTPFHWLPIRSGGWQGWAREDLLQIADRTEDRADAPVLTHPVEFTFYGTDVDAAALRDAIARAPEAFSRFAGQFALSRVPEA